MILFFGNKNKKNKNTKTLCEAQCFGEMNINHFRDLFIGFVLEKNHPRYFN